MRFTTKTIHEGKQRDPQTGAVIFPIYQTATFGQSHPGEPNEFHERSLSYGRTENPTRTVLENTLAATEDAKYGLSFCTGLAAVACVMNTLKTGDHVIACADLYGGSYRMFTKVYSKHGIEFQFVNTTCLSEIESAFKPNTAMVWLETPSNPLLNITDIEGAAGLARSRGVRSLVDNTFATPYLQSPLKLGADIVLHSATKYINGHADVLSGALMTNDEGIWREMKFVQNACGLIPGPQDCFLVTRGIKTLALRMEKHCANTHALVEWLLNQPKIAKVYYPGLESHPGHAMAKKQMRDFGAMVSFELNADVETTKRFLGSLQLITLAESLGCVQTLINHPATMTHASVEADVRHKVGISDGLVRVSVGIEDVEDIIEDLAAALAKI